MSRAKDIFKAIQSNPGLTAPQLGRKLKLNSKQMYNALPSLEKEGLLIYEDDNTRLFAFNVLELDD